MEEAVSLFDKNFTQCEPSVIIDSMCEGGKENQHCKKTSRMFYNNLFNHCCSSFSLLKADLDMRHLSFNNRFTDQFQSCMLLSHVESFHDVSHRKVFLQACFSHFRSIHHCLLISFLRHSICTNGPVPKWSHMSLEGLSGDSPLRLRLYCTNTAAF